MSFATRPRRAQQAGLAQLDGGGYEFAEASEKHGLQFVPVGELHIDEAKIEALGFQQVLRVGHGAGGARTEVHALSSMRQAVARRRRGGTGAGIGPQRRACRRGNRGRGE